MNRLAWSNPYMCHSLYTLCLYVSSLNWTNRGVGRVGGGRPRAPIWAYLISSFTQFDTRHNLYFGSKFDQNEIVRAEGGNERLKLTQNNFYYTKK